jgi:hypothetical protein
MMVFQQLIERIAKLTIGNSAVSSITALEGMISLKRYGKTLLRKRMLIGAFQESKSQMKDLCGICAEHISPVTSPLALISQVQRSGGSLLSQLFDGHPEIHAHPHELHIGYPKKYMWPKIDLNERPQRWLEILFEDKVIDHFKEGYRKERRQDEVFPFIFMPSVQRKVFLKYLNSINSITLRDVLDAYMTSYFEAWLNNQNRYGHKKYVAAFTPRLATIEDNMESFFEVYPDGRLLSIVRDPTNWYPSAFRHETSKNKYEEIKDALGQWNDSTQAMIRNKKRYGNRVCIIRFEDLVSDTEKVMKYLAEFLEIDFDSVLLTPTFNKVPIKANTSFKVEKPGIMRSTLSRYKTLKEEELEIITSMTREVYESVLEEATTF